VNHMGLIRQTLLKRLTEQHNDSPATALRPFDKDATGSTVAEAVDCSFWKSLSTRGRAGENLCGAVRIWGESGCVSDYRSIADRSELWPRRSAMR